MTDINESLSDPRGRAIAVMERHEQGEEAKKALVAIGVKADEIHVIDGQTNAAMIDDSAKWFADTDELLHSFKQKLETGATLVSTPVMNDQQLKEIQAIFYASGAHSMTNFGTILTRTVDLDDMAKEKPLDDK